MHPASSFFYPSSPPLHAIYHLALRESEMRLSRLFSFSHLFLAARVHRRRLMGTQPSNAMRDQACGRYPTAKLVRSLE
jgi:hypothetical protein